MTLLNEGGMGKKEEMSPSEGPVSDGDGIANREDRDSSLAGVGEDEIMEPKLLGGVADRGEKIQQQIAEVVGSDTVEIVFALASRFDESGDSEESQVMADGGLTLPELAAEIRHV
jgi:hypothetical protein